MSLTEPHGMASLKKNSQFMLVHPIEIRVQDQQGEQEVGGLCGKRVP